MRARVGRESLAKGLSGDVVFYFVWFLVLFIFFWKRFSKEPKKPKRQDQRFKNKEDSLFFEDF